jgi:glycosyltransferase involved in cell wall biosynthesis
MARLGVRVVLKEAGIIICRNQGMLEALKALGGQKLRIELVPGFMGLSGRQVGPLPKEVNEFSRTHEPVLGATVNLSPEYGVPLALQAVEQMQKLYPKIGLILIGLGPEAEKDLPDLPLVRHHVLLAGQLSPDVTLSVMKRLSVFLRPTYFDGDSVSVREALALGIPVVASDTGFRPDGLSLFKIGDCVDLCRQLHMALDKGNFATKVNASRPPEEGSAGRMWDLYREL